MEFISSANPLVIGLIVLSIATLVLLGLVIWMYNKLRKFLINIEADSIADSLNIATKELRDLQEFRREMNDYLTSVEKRLRKSVQSVHTVRFNPFQGTGSGGNQSFATAFLNEEGDGVVISSLYARDRVSIFGKSLKNNKSEHELSDEEKEALENAQAKLQYSKHKNSIN